MRTIDPIAHVRARPEMYLPGGVVDPKELARLLVRDALLLGANHARAMRATDWWLVLADRDWLGQAQGGARDLFSRVVPFPEVGPNAMRAEVLLTAFAEEVVTFTPDFAEVIKGEGRPAGDGPMGGESLPWFELPLWFGPLQPKRVVAFRTVAVRPVRRPALAATA